MTDGCSTVCMQFKEKKFWHLIHGIVGNYKKAGAFSCQYLIPCH